MALRSSSERPARFITASGSFWYSDASAASLPSLRISSSSFDMSFFPQSARPRHRTAVRKRAVGTPGQASGTIRIPDATRAGPWHRAIRPGAVPDTGGDGRRPPAGGRRNRARRPAGHSNVAARHAKSDIAAGLWHAGTPLGAKWRKAHVCRAFARSAIARQTQRRVPRAGCGGPRAAAAWSTAAAMLDRLRPPHRTACRRRARPTRGHIATMTMPAFLRPSACPLLLSAATPLALAGTVTGTVQVDRPGAVIAPELYGQFMEQLGTGIDGGIWVGPDSDIPNTRGYRNDVLAALKELQVPVLRWPGGCYADIYDWRTGIGPRDQRPV